MGLLKRYRTGWEEQAIAARRNAAEGGTAKSLDTEVDQEPGAEHVCRRRMQPAAVWSSSSNRFQSRAFLGLAPDARKIIATARPLSPAGPLCQHFQVDPEDQADRPPTASMKPGLRRR